MIQSQNLIVAKVTELPNYSFYLTRRVLRSITVERKNFGVDQVECSTPPAALNDLAEKILRDFVRITCLASRHRTRSEVDSSGT